MNTRPLRIAMLGARGIPARYGGFETCVEEVATRLAGWGQSVRVYCRAPYYPERHTRYRGVELVTLPTIRNKYLDTPVHSLLSALHALARKPDIVVVFGVGNSPIAALLRLAGLPVILNVDGLDWKRAKWPGFARAALRRAEGLAGHAADRVLTDSLHIQHYYRRRYGHHLDVIPYGASPQLASGTATLERFGLESQHYVLYVGRLEPENSIHTLVEASGLAALNMPTVIVGDAPYADGYREHLESIAGDEVIFAGGVYGDGYWELNWNAGIYVFPVTSSGTHPALIEAMACENIVLVRDTADNRAVGGDAVLYFHDPASLAKRMLWCLDHPDQTRDLARRARERAIRVFSWDRVATMYLDLAREVTTPQAVSEQPAFIASSDPVEAANEDRIVDALAQVAFRGRLPDDVISTGQQREMFKIQTAVHGLGPQLGQRVESGDLRLDPDIDAWLSEQIHFNRRRQELLQADLRRVLDAFDEAGIPITPLKGTAMLVDSRRDISWRPMADLDFLVQHNDQQEINLAYAHAGYCLPPCYSTGLSGLTWKHLHYQPVGGFEPPIDYLGEHPDHPRPIESHPAVLEMYRGIGWDITRWITANLRQAGNAWIPNDQAMSLHLAVHCSVSIMEGKLRLCQLVDLAEQLRLSGVMPILTAVEKSDAGRYARFAYPALALLSRIDGDPAIAVGAARLETNVPVSMARWLRHVPLADLAWPRRRQQGVLDPLSRWAISPVEQARLALNIVAPPPRDLDSMGFNGSGIKAILSWYPRYYRKLVTRTTAAIRH